MKKPDYAVKNDQVALLARAPLYLQGVTFSCNNLPVLKELDFTIHPGEKMLISGPNGSGKTTLLYLLMRMLRPENGQILYGTRLISEIPLQDWAGNIAYIPQNSSLIFGGLAENIALKEAPGADEYLKQLYADLDLVESITKDREYAPDSPDFLKNNLSTGEIQRIAIGRAVYKLQKAGILIADEIFAHIDNKNRKRILEILHSVWQDKTVIWVSHEEPEYTFDRKISLDRGNIHFMEN